MADTPKVPQSLKERLKKKRVPVDDINKFLAYVRGAQQQEAKKDADKRPVTSNDDDMLYTMFMKFWNLGLIIDGVNVVITGRAMAMVTFHGYKNKVKKTYPSAKFDIQLMRKGDTFKVSKIDGRISYNHDIANAFSEEEITGAYCIIKIDGVDYFEGLNKKDFEKMKGQSKQSFLWNMWDSEFWLKSVIKRACKRHFYDDVAEIDRNDNEDYGVSDKAMVPTQDIESLVAECKTFDDMTALLNRLSPSDKVLAQPFIDDKMEKLLDEKTETEKLKV